MIKIDDRVRSLYRTGPYAAHEGTVKEVLGNGFVSVVMDSTGELATFNDFALQVFDPAPKVVHLWDVEHPGSFPVDRSAVIPTWEEFLNYNLFVMSDGGSSLLIRWDWTKADELRGVPDVLDLYFVYPFDGLFHPATVVVSEDDEPAVRAWLAKHAEVVSKMWAPLSLGGIRG